MPTQCNLPLLKISGAAMAGGTSKRNPAVAPPTFGDITIYLAQDPVDFRLGINGLSTMVEATLKFDPFSRNLFCFVNKRASRVT